MSLRTKLAFCLSIGLFAFFCFGISDRGQDILRGKIPTNARHFEMDDIYMGAAFAPWVYGLVPALLSGAAGFVLLRSDRDRNKTQK